MLPTTAETDRLPVRFDKFNGNSDPLPAIAAAKKCCIGGGLRSSGCDESSSVETGEMGGE